jgi:Carotenoid biosynthesis protein
MGAEIVGTLVGRWYVTLFGIAYVVLAVRHLGWRRTAVYTAVALAVGALAENGSVHAGIPYTRYSFDADLRGDELFLGDVPLMVTLSYTFMAYFAFGAARLVVAGPYRSRSAMPVLEYVTAVVLGVWLIWVIDPISRLGAHFFLGEPTGVRAHPGPADRAADVAGAGRARHRRRPTRRPPPRRRPRRARRPAPVHDRHRVRGGSHHR